MTIETIEVDARERKSSQASDSRHRRQRRNRESCANSLRNIYHNCERFLFDHAWLLAARSELRESAAWQSLPQYERRYLDGIDAQLRHELDKLHEFSYEFPGQGRLLISDPEYRKIDPCEVSQFWSHTGAFAWKESPSTVFYQSSESRA